MSGVLLLGGPAPELSDVARSLGATVEAQPAVEAPGADWSWAETLQQWRSEVEAGPASRHVVLAPWVDAPAGAALAEVGLDEWLQRGEVALARWVAAFGAAKARCADGGVVVALVDRPAPLDCAGWAPESGVADAVEALTRSLARSEGGRGVRVAAVTTPARLTHGTVVDPAPPLAAFPGSVLLEAVGAVRLLLEPDALGLTGTVVHADCGRSWR